MKLNDLQKGDIIYNISLDMKAIVRNVFPGQVWYQMYFNGKYDSSISWIDSNGIKHWQKWIGA